MTNDTNECAYLLTFQLWPQALTAAAEAALAAGGYKDDAKQRALSLVSHAPRVFSPNVKCPTADSLPQVSRIKFQVTFPAGAVAREKCADLLFHFFQRPVHVRAFWQ